MEETDITAYDKLWTFKGCFGLFYGCRLKVLNPKLQGAGFIMEGLWRSRPDTQTGKNAYV